MCIFFEADADKVDRPLTFKRRQNVGYIQKHGHPAGIVVGTRRTGYRIIMSKNNGTFLGTMESVTGSNDVSERVAVIHESVFVHPVSQRTERLSYIISGAFQRLGCRYRMSHAL